MAPGLWDQAVWKSPELEKRALYCGAAIWYVEVSRTWKEGRWRWAAILCVEDSRTWKKGPGPGTVGRCEGHANVKAVQTVLNWRVRYWISEFRTMLVRSMIGTQLDVSMVPVIAGGVVSGLSLACDCGQFGCCGRFGTRKTRGATPHLEVIGKLWKSGWGKPF